MSGKLKVAGFVVIGILLILVPVLVRDDYYMHIVIMSLVWCVLASSFNLIAGYTGQLSVAHGAFYGIGAYSSAFLVMRLGFNYWLALPVAGLIAVVFAVFIGLVSLRTRGIYFAITTIGFCIIATILMENLKSVTGGVFGLKDIPVPSSINLGFYRISFESKASFYYLILAIFLITVYVTKKILDSGTGRAFVFLREDEMLAEVMGVYAMKYKILSFCISSFFAALAGSFYAHYITFISPVSFTFFTSIEILVLAVVGGLGTILGPVLGAFFLTALPEILHAAHEFRMILYGSIIILTIIYMPRGLVGGINVIVERLGGCFSGVPRSAAEERVSP